MPDLSELRQSGLIRQDELSSIERDLRAGGSLINHLHRQVGDRVTFIWQALAERSQRAFIAQPGDAGPIDVRLLPCSDALDFLVVPRVRRFTTIHLITPDPFARLSDYAPLRSQLGSLVPGGQATLRLDVTTPPTFRELFNLAYPAARSQYRDAQDAAVLAALLPRRAQQAHRLTPEETVAALALFENLPYLDPGLDPPHPQALGDHPFGPFVARRLYPHSTDERGRLVVLGSVEKNDELAQLQDRMAALQDALQIQLTLTLTSTRNLVRLFKAHPGDPHAERHLHPRPEVPA